MTREEAIIILENERPGCGEKAVYPEGEVCEAFDMAIEALEQPEIVQCKECKHNPNEEWFGCPMAHLSETQRPDDAWCWKGERRNDG